MLLPVQITIKHEKLECSSSGSLNGANFEQKEQTIRGMKFIYEHDYNVLLPDKL